MSEHLTKDEKCKYCGMPFLGHEVIYREPMLIIHATRDTCFLRLRARLAELERENAELRNAVEAMNLKALRAAHEPLQRRGDITIQLLRLLRPLAAWERANGSAVG